MKTKLQDGEDISPKPTTGAKPVVGAGKYPKAQAVLEIADMVLNKKYGSSNETILKAALQAELGISSGPATPTQPQ